MNGAQDELLFGRLAVHYKLITPARLEEVHGLRALAGGRRQLTEILVEMGYLTPRQVEQLLAVERDYLAKRAQARSEHAAQTAPAAAAPAAGQGPPAPAAAGPAAGQAPPAPPPAPPASTPSAESAAFPWRSAAQPLAAVLDEAVRRGASDVHLHSTSPLCFRRHGRLVEVDPRPVEPAEARRMIEEILTGEQLGALDAHGQIDFAHELPGRGRFRVSVYRQQRGVDAVFRIIPPAPPTLAELGLPESLARLADYHQGLVLITGPASCGKSSTLAALIRIINERRTDHLVAVEDPIEFIHPSRRCIVNQRQVGPHSASFGRALRAALREDPDVIAIGELRDLETVALAITAAETGHLVLATLHTNNSIRTINRLLGVFPPDQQAQMRTMLAESLRAVVSQRLVPRADGNGRVPAIEVLLVTRAVANLIREAKTFQIRSALQTGAVHGMVQLDASLAELVKARVISREEALKQAEDPQKFPV